MKTRKNSQLQNHFFVLLKLKVNQNSYSTWKPLLLLYEPATQTGRKKLKANISKGREKIELPK